MHDAYDWLKDIWLPTLAGIGSIAVGLVAAVVARQSHNLAVQVRKDESKRDEAAARERYRDQLFRTIEPTLNALREHLDLLETSAPSVGSAIWNKVTTRLTLVEAVADDVDLEVLNAISDLYENAMRTDHSTQGDLIAQITLNLPKLLDERQRRPDLAAQLRVLNPPPGES